MRALFLVVGAILATSAAFAEGLPWSKGGTFSPEGSTTSRMVGPLTLVAGADGKLSAIEFPSGNRANVVSLGMVESEWDYGPEPIMAEIVELTTDPGKMLNGKALCGDTSPARFAVIFVGSFSLPESQLWVHFYNGNEAPKEIYADGLCAPLSYALK